MQSAATIDAVDFMQTDMKPAAQQMPLTFMKSGETARVLKVRGNEELHHHLENLGFVQGAPIKVVSVHGGNVIVEIKGSQIGLDKSAASKIIAG